MKKKIKLFIDAHILDEKYQGTRTILENIFPKVPEVNNNIELFVSCKSVDKYNEVFSKVKNTHFIPYKNKNKIKRIFFDIPGIISKYKIDFAHFFYVAPPINTKKIITTICDTLFLDFPDEFPLSYRQLRRFLFKNSVQRSSIIFTISEYSRRSIINHFGIDKERIEIMNMGIDDRASFQIDRRNASERILSKYAIQKYVLYISRIEPRKNHDFLLRAFSELKLYEKGYSLVLIGKNDLINTKFETQYNGLSERIRASIIRFDQIPKDDINDMISASDLFVYPSKAEGFGLPPIEAAALGVSTICSNSTALREFEFFSDRFFSPNDLNEFKDKIQKYINNNEGMQRIRDIIINRFDWTKSAEYFSKIISTRINVV